MLGLSHLQIGTVVVTTESSGWLKRLQGAQALNSAKPRSCQASGQTWIDGGFWPHALTVSAAQGTGATRGAANRICPVAV